MRGCLAAKKGSEALRAANEVGPLGLRDFRSMQSWIPCDDFITG